MIPPDTSIGKVRLRVADLDDLTTFYERVVGLDAVERDGELARLGPAGGEPVIELVSAPDAAAAPSFSTGLFHLAILVPDRAELARSLQRLAGAGWRLTGASDHLVSEALYLRDPEGNGIEIYRDRPREEWRRDGDELAMATLPLDLESVLGELEHGEAHGERDARRHDHGPRAPPGRGHPARRGLLQRRARPRRDGALLSRRAVPGGRRLPPSPRAQHLAEPGRAAAAGGRARAGPLRARAAERGGARQRRGPAGAGRRRPAAHWTRACWPPTRRATACCSPRATRSCAQRAASRKRTRLSSSLRVMRLREVGGHRAEASVASRGRDLRDQRRAGVVLERAVQVRADLAGRARRGERVAAAAAHAREDGAAGLVLRAAALARGCRVPPSIPTPSATTPNASAAAASPATSASLIPPPASARPDAGAQR